MSNPTVSLSDIQQVKLTAKFTDADGNPTTPAGPVTWATEAGNPGNLTLAPNNLDNSCTVKASATLGTFTVTASSTDIDGAAISAGFDLQVVASGAKAMSIVADAPVNQ